MAALVGAFSLWTVPAFAQVVISIDDATASGGMAVVNVSLASNGASVGGMQNDIIFDNTQVQLSAATQCRINPEIGLSPPGGDCLEDTSVGPCKNLSRVLNTCGGTPQAQGCPEGAGTNISVFRGIIAATAAPNNNAIPDGVLYTCMFTVVSTPSELTNSNVVVSNPTGTRLDSTADSGTISGEGGEPTATPTEGGGEPTATPTIPTDVVVIDIEDLQIDEAGMAEVDVNLITNGMSVGGMQNDIIFDNTLVSLSAATQCRINPAIGLSPPGGDCLEDTSVGPCKNLSRVLNTCGGTPQAQGCPEGAGSNISVFRGIIAATAAPNNNEIPDGPLYTCTFTANSSAGLDNNNVVVSNPTGTRLDSFGADGSITVGGGQVDTPTPAVDTPTPVQPTATNTVPVVPTATNTSPPQATSTATPGEEPTQGEECSSTLAAATTATDVAITLANADCFPDDGGVVQIGASTTRGYAERSANQLFLTQPVGSIFPVGTVVTLLRGAGDDDDGCHIRGNATNTNAWMLLIPALGLLALRRRR
jgi:hypothetical protein